MGSTNQQPRLDSGCPEEHAKNRNQMTWCCTRHGRVGLITVNEERVGQVKRIYVFTLFGIVILGILLLYLHYRSNWWLIALVVASVVIVAVRVFRGRKPN